MPRREKILGCGFFAAGLKYFYGVHAPVIFDCFSHTVFSSFSRTSFSCRFRASVSRAPHAQVSRIHVFVYRFPSSAFVHHFRTPFFEFFVHSSSSFLHTVFRAQLFSLVDVLFFRVFRAGSLYIIVSQRSMYSPPHPPLVSCVAVIRIFLRISFMCLVCPFNLHSDCSA